MPKNANNRISRNSDPGPSNCVNSCGITKRRARKKYLNDLNPHKNLTYRGPFCNASVVQCCLGIKYKLIRKKHQLPLISSSNLDLNLLGQLKPLAYFVGDSERFHGYAAVGKRSAAIRLNTFIVYRSYLSVFI